MTAMLESSCSGNRFSPNAIAYKLYFTRLEVRLRSLLVEPLMSLYLIRDYLKQDDAKSFVENMDFTTVCVNNVSAKN